MTVFMPDFKTCTKGKAAELVVANYLEKSGYRIIDKNFTVHMVGEIDLIAIKNETVCFFEVKYRKNKQAYDIPNYCISSDKLKKVKRCADIYLQRENLTDKYCKFIGALVHNLDGNKIPEIKLMSLD